GGSGAFCGRIRFVESGRSSARAVRAGSARRLSDNGRFLREHALHPRRICKSRFVGANDLVVVRGLDIFEEAVGVVEPDLRDSVEGSEKYARRGIGYDPRLDVAANGFLDDGLAGEERPMSISPVRKKLVECHLGVAHDKNIQLQHSDAAGEGASSPTSSRAAMLPERRG